MRRSGLGLWLAVAVAWTGCAAKAGPASAPTGDSSGGEQPSAGLSKQALEAMLAEELAEQPIHELSSPDGSVRARIEASATPTVTPGEGLVTIVAPFGSAPVQCMVFPERKDAADMVRLMVDATLAKVAPQHQWVEVHGDQVRGWPYLIGRAHYLAETERGKLFGDFKIASSTRGATSVVCVHDSPGHYAGFERVLRSLLDTLDSASSRALELLDEIEITRTRIPGRMVSMSVHELTLVKGARMIAAYEHTISIGAQGTLISSDDVSVRTYRKGLLQSATFVQASRGEIDYQLELNAGKKNHYSVTGTLQAKPFSAELDVPGGLLDDVKTDAIVCGVARGKKPTADMLDYAPDADPSAPTAMHFEKSQNAELPLHVTMGKDGAIQMDAALDDECKFRKAAIAMGEISIELERLWIEKPKTK